MTNKTPVTYEDAGVSVERGNELVERIKEKAAATHHSAVIGGLGGFGALYDLASLNYREPVLVSGADGVGTKIKLAIQHQRHDTIGIDLVGMCVNDLIVQGARPLFFLDYFASSRLDVESASQVVSSIADGCKLANCSLVGGETAEMPGMYAPGDYDLAGFCVGVVERSKIINGSSIRQGDRLIALPSSGPHSNGYSLIRKLIDDNNVDLSIDIAGRPLLDCLMEPTRIYVKNILRLLHEVHIKGISHITGGGLIENIPRVMPKNTAAKLDTTSWQMPEIFKYLQSLGNIDTKEMYRTFNCGVGLVITVDSDDEEKTLNFLRNEGENPWTIGKIVKSSDIEKPTVILK